MRRALLLLGLVGAPLALGCGALRQNLRNQFLSYRGAWQCEGGNCKMPAMKRSIKQHREGETDITHVTMHNQVAMVFNAGAAPDSFSAKISCGGDVAEVPAERIKAFTSSSFDPATTLSARDARSSAWWLTPRGKAAKRTTRPQRASN
ncbi:MAG: hypothetical protein ACE37F_28500 [Nannocystaceae bacterium]|nr:hypothetical protein [bacterium]